MKVDFTKSELVHLEAAIQNEISTFENNNALHRALSELKKEPLEVALMQFNNQHIRGLKATGQKVEAAIKEIR